MSRQNLTNAKKAKCDEFYTQLIDIEKELSYYDIKGKKVYCNCDDYRVSNFTRYFRDNFRNLGIVRLVCTNKDLGNGAYAYTYDGSAETIDMLKGNGDFRSEECIEFLKEADVVVTNPPFSLFREYVAQLMEYGKKFIILGNGNAVTYKEIFPFIKNNELWWGASLHMTKCHFVVPFSYNGDSLFVENGVKYAKVNNVVWFTNIDHKKRNTPLDLYKKYNSKEYPKYDNYDAIEVSKVSDIPMDYDGAIGVPITFLDKYCPDQFEIIKFRKGNDDKDLSVNGKCPYFRILIRRRNMSKLVC